MSNKLIMSAGLLIYLVVNGLFVAKYGSRVTDHYAIALVGYVVVVAAVVFWLQGQATVRRGRAIFWGVIGIIIAMVLAAYVAIPQEELRVDRFEMIRLFWDNIFEGRNAYTRRPHGGNIPGPFPFYFVLAFPFYLIGELGFFTLSGFVLFAVLVDRFVASDRDKVLIAVLLLMSPAVGWELVTRSTLFLNTALVLAMVIWARRIDLRSTRGLVFSALLFGLALSTRSVAVLVLAPYFFLSRIHFTGIKKVATWGLLASLTFALTIVPVALYDGFFTENNPFSVQGFFLHPWIPVLTLAAICYLAATTDSMRPVVFASGFGIALLVAVYVSTEILDHGIGDVVLRDWADISYFLLAFPAVILGMAESLADPVGRVASARNAGRDDGRLV